LAELSGIRVFARWAWHHFNAAAGGFEMVGATGPRAAKPQKIGSIPSRRGTETRLAVLKPLSRAPLGTISKPL
jgi:hypothetical protein